MATGRSAPIARWSGPRSTMLGDAVHATLPYMAQGAAMAIEDAAVLARALALDLPPARRRQVYEQHRPGGRRVQRDGRALSHQ